MKETKPTTPPQADRRAYLAEHMSAECPDCHGVKIHLGRGACQGPGWRPLLRQGCPNTCTECREQHHTVPLERCAECSGRNYVYDGSPNALTEAIRAKGWAYDIISRPDFPGDAVDVHDNSTVMEIHGGVGPDEGLRGQEALEVALYRACRAEAGE